MKSRIYAAPWSRQLKLLTLLCSIILLGITLALLLQTPDEAPAVYQLGIWIPVATLVLGALFTVRGYQVEGSQLYVLRLGWHSRLSLTQLETVTVDSSAMDGSIRLFGNGGLFAYLGLFQNKPLGRYRAYATDAARSVVLKLRTRTIVITPDDPETFAHSVAHLVTKNG
ncbi:PH domain-containing protein [Microbulbifer sp. HZ11]|uniref:PH domain-containing protein n=1 Tax=Microbulbifer sp. HZ11 TaxID=1453501 RepID=UPI0005B9E1CE|nr:PH domain-containing protein [Microbulbifer sp. HZ11]